MARLSTLLVQRQIASLRDVEEALARQVLYGGDLVSNFLEQTRAPLDEGALTRAAAEALDMSECLIGALPDPPQDVQSTVPKDLAIRHAFYPLDREGDTLRIAVAQPLSVDAEEEIAFSLGVRIDQVMALYVRIREALDRTHGLVLDRRSARALARLAGLPDPSPSRMPSPLEGAPDLSSLPRPATIPPFGSPSTSLFEEGARATNSVHDAITAPAPPVEERDDLKTSPSWPPPSQDSPPDTVGSAATARGWEQQESFSPTNSPSEPPTVAETAVAKRNAAERASASEDAASGGQDEGAVRGTQATATGAAGSMPHTERRPTPEQAPGDTTAVRDRPSKPEHRRSRHRGPYTAAAAERDLLDAEERDDVLGAFFDFAAQYFEYAALFAVVGDIAEGRDAHGPGASHSDVTGIGVPLDLPSVLSRARERLLPELVLLGDEGLDAQLASDLKRRSRRKVLIVPIAVRGRCVVIFYGDDGDTDVELSDVGDVIAFAPRVATGLENVIRRKKTAARAASTSAPAAKMPRFEPPEKRSKLPSRGERVSALADVLGGGPARSSSAPPSSAPSSSAPSSSAPSSSAPSGAERPSSAPRHEGPPPKPASSSPEPEHHTPPQALAGPSRPASSAPHAGAAPAKPVALAPNLATSPPKAAPPAGTPPPKPTSAPARPLASTPTPKPTSTRSHTSSPPPKPTTSASPLGASAPPKPTHPSSPPPKPTSAPPEPHVGTPPPKPTSIPPRASRAPAGGGSSSPDEASDDGWDAPADAERTATSAAGSGGDLRALMNDARAGKPGVAARIRQLGDPAIAALVAEFPGPLDREGARDVANPAFASPVIAALIDIGPAAVPHLMQRAGEPDPEVRMWVTRTLGEIASAESAKGVARRAVDRDPAVHLAARQAGRTLLSAEASRTALRETTCELVADDSAPIRTRILAVEALADWRDRLSVPRLIPFVAEPVALAPTVRSALSEVTRQAFGADTDAWWGWWHDNSDKHRIEWLMAALAHDDPDLRRAAGEELVRLTDESFGEDDSTPEDRKHVQDRYRKWWDSVGKARFVQ